MGMVVLGFFIGVLCLFTLITVHEFGHFVIAKLFKVYVYEFSIGFGPKIFTIKGKETWYTFRLIPLGGYNSIATDLSDPPKGREDDEVPDERKMDYTERWKKMFIILFGPFVNLFIALFFFTIIYAASGEKLNDMSYFGSTYDKDKIAYKLINKKENPNGVSQIDQNTVIWGVEIAQLVNNNPNEKDFNKIVLDSDKDLTSLTLSKVQAEYIVKKILVNNYFLNSDYLEFDSDKDGEVKVSYNENLSSFLKEYTGEIIFKYTYKSSGTIEELEKDFSTCFDSRNQDLDENQFNSDGKFKLIFSNACIKNSDNSGMTNDQLLEKYNGFNLRDSNNAVSYESMIYRMLDILTIANSEESYIMRFAYKNVETISGDVISDSLSQKDIKFSNWSLTYNGADDPKLEDSKTRNEYYLAGDTAGMSPPTRIFSSGWVAYTQGWKDTFKTSLSILKSFSLIFTGQFKQISGPFGVANQTQSFLTSPQRFFIYFAELSANLFVLNLIIIPPLDGYRLLENFVEMIIRKPVDKKVKYILYGIGAFLFVSLFTVITIKDLLT